MSNKFIKISAPPESAAEAEALRQQERERKEQKRKDDKIQAQQRIREQESKFRGQDPAKKLINSTINIALEQGKNAEALRIELEQRAVLIRKLLNQIPEDLVAQYFDEFLFKNEIPWTKSADLMELALNTTRFGTRLQDALDFVLAHYSEKRNFQLTADIMHGVKDLQPKMRTLNIMKILKDAMVGDIGGGFNLVMMGPRNVENFVILNELVALATAKPDEDLEQTRIQFQKSLDAFTRSREVDDRYKAIFQMLLSDEFNRVMKRNVEFATNIFQMSVNDPNMLALRRILVSLKMGEAMKKQLFSDLFQKQTAPDTQTETGVKIKASVIENNTRIAQKKPTETKQTQNVLPAENQNALLPYMNGIKRVFELSIAKINQQQQAGVDQPIDYESIKKNLNGYIQSIDEIITAINSKKLTNELFNGKFWDAAYTYLSPYKNWAPKEFKENIQFEATQEERDRNAAALKEYYDKTSAQPTQYVPYKQTPTANSNKFVKISQIAQTLSSWANVLKPDSLLDGIINASGILTTASGVATLDVSKMVGGLVFTLLYNNHKQQAADLKNLGLDAPVKAAGEFESVNAGNNFERLAESFNQSQQYQKLEAALNDIDQQINESENNLLQITEANLKTGTGRGQETTVAYGNPKEVEKAYKEHRVLLEKGMQIAEYFRRMVDGLVAVAQNDPKYKDFLQSTGSVSAMKVHISNLVNKYRKQYFEYASPGLIAGNMLQKKKLIQQLKTLIPQLEGYLGAGLSIADLIRIPGGLGERLRSIIDQEKQARDTLFAAISGMEQYIQNKKLVKTVYQPEIYTGAYGTGPQPKPTTSPTSGAPSGAAGLTQAPSSPKASNPLADMAKQWATKQLGPQFSGLVNLFANDENENVRLASPSELSQSYTDNFRYSNIIVEAADTSGVNPLALTTNTPQYGYYLNLINKAQNLGYIENYINTKETKLQPLEKTQLLDMIKRMNHYIAKTSDPLVNKTQLRNYISKDVNLNNEQKQTLLNLTSSTVQQLAGLSNIAGQVMFTPQQAHELAQKGITTQQAIDYITKSTAGVGSTSKKIDLFKGIVDSLVGTKTTPKSPVQQAGELGGKIGTEGSKPGTIPGTGAAPLSPEEEQNRQLLNAIFANINQSTGLNISVDPEGVEKQPELFLESLTNQWRQREEAYQGLRNIQYKLLTEPIRDLSALNSLASTPFKFIKTAENKDDLNDKEADQKNIDYVGDYYDELYEESEGSPEFGEALKHPQKWRKVKTEDIPEQD